MKCIYCGNKETDVKNSRKIKGNSVVWRRRECIKCNKIFTTKETHTEDNLFVIKRNKTRQRFMYYKFFASIFNIINFGKFHDSGDSAKLSKKIADAVLNNLYKLSNNKEIESKHIILMTHSYLMKIKKSYADYFANYSEYRQKVIYDQSKRYI